MKQYSFISQIMTFTDTALEKFYLFAKLLLRQLPYEKQTLPLEVIEMIDMDKYRAQEEQNGRITLKGEDGVLELTSDDGYRGGQGDEEKIKLIIQKLNKDYGISFEEADRHNKRPSKPTASSSCVGRNSKTASMKLFSAMPMSS